MKFPDKNQRISLTKYLFAHDYTTKKPFILDVIFCSFVIIISVYCYIIANYLLCGFLVFLFISHVIFTSLLLGITISNPFIDELNIYRIARKSQLFSPENPLVILDIKFMNDKIFGSGIAYCPIRKIEFRIFFFFDQHKLIVKRSTNNHNYLIIDRAKNIVSEQCNNVILYIV